MSDYDNALARQTFIQTYKNLDYAYGGKMNLCDLAVIKSLWKKLYPTSEGVPSITIIQYFFRNSHIEYMYKLKAEGKTPFSLLELGFLAKTINKYWDNRTLAEAIVGHELP